jgi:hypothetical protein
LLQLFFSDDAHSFAQELITPHIPTPFLDGFSANLRPAFGEAITEGGGQIGVKGMASGIAGYQIFAA